MRCTLTSYQTNLDTCFQNLTSSLGTEHCFHEPLAYLWSTGGKRVRPLLFLALIDDFGIPIKPFQKVALSLELLHLASLLHDDLPALDNDNYRRGQPTVHVQFAEHTALLLGDWLVGCSMNLAAELPADLCILPSLHSLWMDICVGQELDMRGGVDSDAIFEIHRLKTSRFFETIGDLVSKIISKHDSRVYPIARWGAELGHFFQQVDDFLDRCGSPKETGRPSSSDQRNKKNTSYQGARSAEIYRQEKEKLQKKLILIHDSSSFEHTVAVLDLAFRRLESI